MKIDYLLFFLGIFLIFMTLVASQVLGSWSTLATVVTIVGIASIIAGLIRLIDTNKGFWGMRSTEATTNALVSTVAVLLIVALVNFLGIKYAIKLDATENKLFTLSPQSQELVKSLSSPMTVYVFDKPINESDRQLLNDYTRYSNFFDYQFVNPQVDINLAQQFQVNRNGDVYLQYQNRQQLVQILSPENRLSEVKLTNAIAQIQKERQAQIYILQGQGEAVLETGAEASFAQAVTSLTNQGYIVDGLNLSTSPLVPPATDVLIVSSASIQLSPQQIDAIQQYVDSGGNLLVMYNAQSLNSIPSILQPWGVTFDDSLAIDISGTGELFGFGPTVNVVIDYGKHPITEDFQNNLTVFPWARPILTQPIENIEKTPLLITNSQSWGETDLEADNIEFDPQKDVAGPLELAVALVKKNPQQSQATQTQEQTEQIPTQENEPVISGENDLPLPPTIQTPDPTPTNENNVSNNNLEQKMVVIGNTNFATDGWFQQQLNGDFFLNTIAWLANEQDENLSIRPKQSTNRRLNPSQAQVTFISWLAIAIVPALSLITAIATWWQRNR